MSVVLIFSNRYNTCTAIPSGRNPVGFPSNTWWLLLNSKPKHDRWLCEQGASSAPFTNVCQRISGEMDEELLRRSPAGCRKQRLCPTCTQMLRMFLGASGKRWGTGRANSLHSQWVLKCDFKNPALLWSHYLKACLQHWKLLNVFSCKVVASMYIFILQSPAEGNVWRLSFYEVKAGYILWLQLVYIYMEHSQWCGHDLQELFWSRARQGSPVDESPADHRALFKHVEVQ